MVGIVGALVALAAVIALGSVVGSFWAIGVGPHPDGRHRRQSPFRQREIP